MNQGIASAYQVLNILHVFKIGNPHLCSNLVSTLASLDVDDLPHGLVVAAARLWSRCRPAGEGATSRTLNPSPHTSFPEQPTATPCHLYSTEERFKQHKIHTLTEQPVKLSPLY